MIAEVEVDRSSGKICAKRFTVAHDCGQIINPDGLEKCIEGNIVQGITRTLWEEVKFDNKNVTSVDWLTYPILDITETPEKIDFVLINHPEIAAVGRRRAVDPAGGGGDRQRDLRRHRRADPARAVLAGPGEAGAVVRLDSIDNAKGPAAMPGLFVLFGTRSRATAISASACSPSRSITRCGWSRASTCSIN